LEEGLGRVIIRLRGPGKSAGTSRKEEEGEKEFFSLQSKKNKNRIKKMEE